MRLYLKISLIIFLLLLSTSLVSADDDDERENDPDEIGEKMGTVALVTVSIGGLYVLLRRVYIGSKMVLDKEEYKALLKQIKTVYQKSRYPLLLIHYLTMIIATITAGIHGLYLLDDDLAVTIFGAISVFAMVILSISGILIWRKFNPIWKYRESRTALRYVHRQWLFSGIFLAGLLLHFAFE